MPKCLAQKCNAAHVCFHILKSANLSRFSSNLGGIVRDKKPYPRGLDWESSTTLSFFNTSKLDCSVSYLCGGFQHFWRCLTGLNA